MKLEWKQTARDPDVWVLYLVDKTTKPIKRMGWLVVGEQKYLVRETNSDHSYHLDRDLSLDEALRAAKLFLCVGSPA